MRTLIQLSTDIGNWADGNFGNKRDGFRGMSEEIGEFAGVIDESGRIADQVDALCDVLIYALDYAYFENIKIWPMLDYSFSGYGNSPERTLINMCINKGNLARDELKHKQGIKGYDDLAYFTEQREHNFNSMLIDTLEGLSGLPGIDCPLVQLNETYDNIVSKRNWKLDPENGGGHTHVVDSSDSHITVAEE